MAVKLTWTPLVTGDSQKIYRDTTSFTEATLPAALATVGATDSEYDDATADNATDYYYGVSVIDGARERLSTVLFAPADRAEIATIDAFAFVSSAEAQSISNVDAFAFVTPAGDQGISTVDAFAFVTPV